MDKIKALVLDLDNTLLRSDKTISPDTIEALWQCRERDILVVYATARSRQASSRMCKSFMPDVLICYGGGLVAAAEQVIHRCTIEQELSDSLIARCLQEPAIEHIYAIGESAAYTNDRESIAGDFSHYIYRDFSLASSEQYIKISVTAHDPHAVAEIAAHYPQLDMLRYSGEDLYRFAHRDATKWKSVQAMAETYGISTADIAAFGDDLIDVEMLANCGIGVAMANGVDKVKAVADEICGANDDDGVACWIKQRLREKD